jgi:hypothetical protein
MMYQQPQFLKHASRTVAAVLDELVLNDAIQRVCKYASCKLVGYRICGNADHCLGGYRSYGERNFENMRATVEAIKARFDGDADEQHGLRRSYDDKIGAFPCRSFNLGRQTVTYPHTDNCNLAHSWCSVTPLGNFDHQTGGHLVLWDFGLVVDFPAGSTILIPSSIIVHSNTTIKDNESRFSIVQYAAGGLFRWVKNGFSTQDGDVEIDDERWAKFVKMFTNVAELAEDVV